MRIDGQRSGFHSWAPVLAVAAIATIVPRGVLTSQQAAPRVDRPETALDRYVAAPDASFAWKAVRELPAEGATATLIEMTSQRWLTEKEVDRPLWTHWITVVRPAQITSDLALLFIGGGSNDRQPPARPPAWLVDAARETGTVTAELRLIPNQPITFKDDPTAKPRSEDDFIAYTWDKYLRTGDERWPARLPMTKSAVRAMDALTAFTASPEGGAQGVTRFVVSGASKRGWTTWTTAAVDRRVVAIAPAVIDMLNVEPSFVHHWRVYGAWSEAVKDYEQQGIMDWMGTPEFHALMKIEEPYEYRNRLQLPKYILNASGDQFFLPDSSRFYFDDLKGDKYLRYVPNTSHSLDKTDALESLIAFYTTVVKGTPRPEVKWTFERDGSIKAVAKQRPDDVRIWQAVNPKARNFRHDVIGSAYQSTPLTPSGPNTWVARVPPPAEGWTAFFVEMTFPSGGKYPLKVTSGVRVLPDTLPYPAPKPRRPTTTVASRYDDGVQPQADDRPRLTVKLVDDFEVTGTGDNAAWKQAEWVPLRRRQADGHPYDTRFKMVYSKTGLYFLMEGTDKKVTATMNEDFMDLWNEDVFEVFLWTDERYPVYFEYEISPLNRELPILVPNFGGEFLGWRPWHYEKDRQIRKATSTTGGPRQSQASIQGWAAEFFIPYPLLRPLQNVPPKPGTRWRANFYRMDHDDGKRTQWEWAPVGKTFHEYQKFGELVFAER